SFGLDRLLAIAREEFAAQGIPAEITAQWWPRFVDIARNFVDWESERSSLVADSHCEVRGRVELPGLGFVLRARADRIDVMRDGSVEIIDYKTGTRPTKKQARTLSPQLALEAMMVRLGAFDGISPEAEIGELAYVRLRQGEMLEVDRLSEG